MKIRFFLFLIFEYLLQHTDEMIIRQKYVERQDKLLRSFLIALSLIFNKVQSNKN